MLAGKVAKNAGILKDAGIMIAAGKMTNAGMQLPIVGMPLILVVIDAQDGLNQVKDVSTAGTLV